MSPAASAAVSSRAPRDVAETGEFVVNVASREQVELANHTSAPWSPGADEWACAGGTGLPSRLAAPRRAARLAAPERVAGAPAQAPPV